MPKTSVIIPVYDNWEMTRRCIKSLAENTAGASLEVLVVDNASTDATARGCPVLGKQLFGERFTFIRNEQNNNFAGACNQGAKLARGEFLIFLNDDTELLPNWYAPLLEDFCNYQNLGATGPVCLYPPAQPLGYTIQHLGGVCFSAQTTCASAQPHSSSVAPGRQEALFPGNFCRLHVPAQKPVSGNGPV